MIQRLYQLLFLVALLGATAFDASAKLGVARLFSDHAVLQRDMPVPIWGSADAGKEISVTFRKQTKTAKADKDGKWRLKLDALKAGGPDELSISCGDEKITIADVLVGEVWVGSGQSNMAGGAVSRNWIAFIVPPPMDSSGTNPGWWRTSLPRPGAGERKLPVFEMIVSEKTTGEV